MPMHKIYIVEDLKLEREAYECQLKDSDKYEVIGSFGTAHECLKAMEKRLPNYILMDLGLPVMSGIEATKILKEKYKDEVKIITITSHQQEEDVLLSFSAGADGYVVKDMNGPDLIKILDDITTNGNVIDSKIAGIVLKHLSVPQNRDKYGLTKAEFEVLKHLWPKSFTNTQIAQELHISVSTVKAHLQSIFAKLNVTNRTDAAVLAAQEKLIID